MLKILPVMSEGLCVPSDRRFPPPTAVLVRPRILALHCNARKHASAPSLPGRDVWESQLGSLVGKRAITESPANRITSPPWSWMQFTKIPKKLFKSLQASRLPVGRGMPHNPRPQATAVYCVFLCLCSWACDALPPHSLTMYSIRHVAGSMRAGLLDPVIQKARSNYMSVELYLRAVSWHLLAIMNDEWVSLPVYRFDWRDDDLVKTSIPSGPCCAYFSVIAVNPVMSATISAPSTGVVSGTCKGVRISTGCHSHQVLSYSIDRELTCHKITRAKCLQTSNIYIFNPCLIFWIYQYLSRRSISLQELGGRLPQVVRKWLCNFLCEYHTWECNNARLSLRFFLQKYCSCYWWCEEEIKLKSSMALSVRSFCLCVPMVVLLHSYKHTARVADCGAGKLVISKCKENSGYQATY